LSKPREHDTVIGVTAFKAKCLALIEDVARGKRRRLVITKRGRPLAAVVPLGEEPTELWGAMRGTVSVPPGTDITEPTGEAWDANA
jgi:prevent-host-death family protein